MADCSDPEPALGKCGRKERSSAASTMRATFIGPGVAQRTAYLASEQQVKEWLGDDERGPAPTEDTTAKMAAAASSPDLA